MEILLRLIRDLPGSIEYLRRHAAQPAQSPDTRRSPILDASWPAVRDRDGGRPDGRFIRVLMSTINVGGGVAALVFAAFVAGGIACFMASSSGGRGHPSP